MLPTIYFSCKCFSKSLPCCLLFVCMEGIYIQIIFHISIFKRSGSLIIGRDNKTCGQLVTVGLGPAATDNCRQGEAIDRYSIRLCSEDFCILYMLFVKNRLHFHGTFDLATGLHKLFKDLRSEDYYYLKLLVRHILSNNF